MFHDQHVLTNGMYLPFYFMMSCPEPRMDISSVGSFPVQSGGSLNIISSSLCVGISFKYVFSYFSLEAGVSHFWGICMPPNIFGCPHTFGHPPMLHMLKHPLYVPNAPMWICMFWGVSACDKGCGSHPYIWTPPCVWMPSHVSNIPHIICCPACLYILWIICMCYGGTSHMLGAWGLQHICQAFGVCQYIHWMSIMLHLVPFL